MAVVFLYFYTRVTAGDVLANAMKARDEVDRLDEALKAVLAKAKEQ